MLLLLAATLIGLARRWCQELDICNNVVLTGSSLELLPRCCPGLKNLRLTELAWLRGEFLSALQHLTVCFMLHAMLTIVTVLQPKHTSRL